MKISGLFDNTIEKLKRNLDARALKHEVTLSNIANADTPNFKAFQVIVEEELVKTGSINNSNDLMRTHSSHLLSKVPKSTGVSISEIELSDEITLRGDGNTVNIEKEMAELSENNLMYRATADILSRKFQGLIKVIQGGRR